MGSSSLVANPPFTSVVRTASIGHIHPSLTAPQGCWPSSWICTKRKIDHALLTATPQELTLHTVQRLPDTCAAHEQYYGQTLERLLEGCSAPAEAAAMICAAATGFCDSVVARAVARVEAKDERASGLPAATDQQSLRMPASLRHTDAVHAATAQELPPTSLHVSVV